MRERKEGISHKVRHAKKGETKGKREHNDKEGLHMKRKRQKEEGWKEGVEGRERKQYGENKYLRL